MNKNDKRYQRTHIAIRTAFEELILEKEFAEISISELARRANINRKTFYLHYGSLDDVIGELQEDIMDDLAGLQRIPCLPGDAMGFEELMAGFFSIIQKNIPLHQRLFCSGGYRFVFERIRQAMMKRYALAFRDRLPLDETYLETAMNFAGYGTLFVFRDWLASGRSADSGDIVRFTSRLIRYVAEGLLSDSEEAEAARAGGTRTGTARKG